MAVRTLHLAAAAAALPSSPASRVPWSSLSQGQPPVSACGRSEWTRTCTCSRLRSAVCASPSSNGARAHSQPLIDPPCLRSGIESSPHQLPFRPLLLQRRARQPTPRRGGPLHVLGPHSFSRSLHQPTRSANAYVTVPAAATSSDCWDLLRHAGNGLEGWARRRSDTCPSCSSPRSLFPAVLVHLGRLSSPSARIQPTLSDALGNCRARRRGRGAVIKAIIDLSSRRDQAVVGDRRRWECGSAVEGIGRERVGNYHTGGRWLETRQQRQQQQRRSPADRYRHVSTSPLAMASAKLDRGEGDDGGKQGESYVRLSAEEGEKESSLTGEKKANRLVDEQSPYLLQHAYNPVDWYPWGEEAFAKARSENQPIFLSVGYSTCHWCHVMEVESFESEEVAKLMNDWFVNIKVDREERPDVDKVYMTYVQAMQGSGGWPMSVFLTPDLKPIVGGTYFPPNDMYGRLGFKTVLRRVKEAWEKSQEKLKEGGDQAIQQLAEATSVQAEARDMANEDALEAIQLCVSQLASKYDGRLGGFKGAPKFPRPSEINILLRRYLRLAQRGDVKQSADRVLGMASFTLKCMSRGGMHDHIGGGFHRYSVDEYWHVPHFEKMLYDQGQLANAYLDTFLITADTHFATMARDVLDYLRREMTSPGGGFFSAEDADSADYEGGPKKEGAFYVWTTDELEDILGSERFKVFASHYYVKEDGNCDLSKRSDPHEEFKGKNVLIERSSLAETAAKFGLPENKCAELLGQCRLELHLHRKKRPHPHLDDKIIVAWNGLAISAMARASRILRSEPVEMKHHFPVEGCNPAEYLKAAENAASFLQEKLYDPSTKRLRRSYRNLPSEAFGFIDDYAFLIGGLIDLYEAGGDIRWLTWALELQNTEDELFLDKEGGGYFSVPEGDPTILLRMKEDYDGAEPSGNSVAAMNLLRLSAMLSGRQAENYRSTAEHVMAVFKSRLKDIPMALPQLCCALDLHASNIKRQIIVAGMKGRRDAEMLRNCAHSTFEPDSVVLFVDDEDENVRAFWHEHNPNVLVMAKKVDGKAAAYICQNFVCKAPVTDPESMGRILREPPASTFKVSTLDIQSAMDQTTRPVSS